MRMQTTNVADAKAHLSKLIEKALAGEEVIISKHGKPMVKLVPYERDTSPRDMSVRIWEVRYGWRRILTNCLKTLEKRSQARPMNLLLDTHALIWTFDNNPKLSEGGSRRHCRRRKYSVRQRRHRLGNRD